VSIFFLFKGENMRKLWLVLATGAMLQSAGFAALDMVPSALSVKMLDSVSNPEMDSILVTFTITPKGGSTKPQAPWISADISIEGVLHGRGGVDSMQVFNSGANYTYAIDMLIEKKPFSVICYADPAGVSGEPVANTGNNAITKVYNFHKKTLHDTLYTGKNCGIQPKAAP
jgi:hypothetical protein